MTFAALTARMDAAVNARLGAVAVVYAPAVGIPVAVEGIFDADHVHVAEGQAGVDSVGPACSLLLADLPEDPGTVAGAPTLTVGGVTYRRRAIGARDANRVVILLHRVVP